MLAWNAAAPEICIKIYLFTYCQLFVAFCSIINFYNIVGKKDEDEGPRRNFNNSRSRSSVAHRKEREQEPKLMQEEGEEEEQQQQQQQQWEK